jgi:hypothetical protein
VRADDRRRTCYCGHRYGDHATGGTACLAWVDDPDASSLRLCQCQGWAPLTDEERAAQFVSEDREP